MLRIGILPGDDIGLEVVPACVEVMKAAAAVEDLEIEWVPLPIGRRGHEETGHTFPEVTREALKTLPGWVYGPVGHGSYPKHEPGWILPPVRKAYDLFASIKPVRSYPNLPSLHENIDMVVIREVSEGLQSDSVVVGGMAEFRPNDEISFGSRVITRKGSRRVAREAFELARTRTKKKVTAVHKAPVYRLTCGMFAEECRKVAAEYPDVTFEEGLIDTTAMKLVMAPQQYDVIVTTNQFGDILTDEAAGLVGGLGMAPGLCAGADQAMAQATHGSAPDIAGRNIANPYAMIVSGKMLLDWLGRRHGEPKAVAAAGRIERAVDAVIADGRNLTKDLGGSAGTAEMAQAIAEEVRRAA